MEKVSLVKVSGVSAILAVLLGAAGLVLIMVASPDLIDAKEASEFLPIVEDNREFIATALWLFVLAPVLLMVAALGFYQALRQGGSLMQVAVVTIIAGSLFGISRSLIDIATVYELSPAYAKAEVGSSTRATLEVVTETLGTLGILADLVANVLIVGIGVLLFSLAVLRTSVAPKWVGYLGLVAAVLGGWLPLLGPALSVFEAIGFIGLVVTFVWLVSMGVTLLRQQEVPETQ